MKSVMKSVLKVLKRIFNKRNIILLVLLLMGLALYFLTAARYVAMLIIVPVLLLIGSLVIMAVTGRKLTVSIDAPIQGIRDKEERVYVSISNRSIIPVLMCSFNGEMRNMLNGIFSKSENFVAVGRGKTENFAFKLKEKHCGCVSVSAGNILITDPLRVFSRRAKNVQFQGAQERNIFFMPAARQIVIPPDDLSSFDMESYKYSDREKGGDPSETFDIRDYEQGDLVKSIHWKLSSKTDSLVVREHGLPIQNKVMIIVDKLEASPSADVTDKRTEFASAVSYTLLKQGIVHSIGWYSTASEKFECCRVDNEETYWIAMKGIVSCPYEEQKISSIDRFIESGIDTEEVLSYIYISDSGKGIERLYDHGSVKQFRAEGI